MNETITRVCPNNIEEVIDSYAVAGPIKAICSTDNELPILEDNYRLSLEFAK